MVLVLIVYVVSALSWGTVLFQLARTIYLLYKDSQELPPTLVPLTIASLAILVNSIYFGFSALFEMFGYKNLFMEQFNSVDWFVVYILIAISGIMMLFNLRGLNK